MGKKSRDKGARGERELVNILNAAGIKAKRVPLSGATWLKDDVLADGLLGIEECRIECKVRGQGFKTLYAWLADQPDCLAIKADYKEWLLVVPLRTVITEYIKRMENGSDLPDDAA